MRKVVGQPGLVTQSEDPQQGSIRRLLKGVSKGHSRKPAARRSKSGTAGSMSVPWRRGVAAASVLGVAALAGSAIAATPASAGLLSGPTTAYIVSDTGAPDASAALSAVGRVGAAAAEELDAGDAVLANLTSLQAQILGHIPGVVLTPDVSVSVQDTTSQPSATRAPAAVFAQQTGAPALWTQGDTGAGVNVAILDTGIDPLPDLAGRLTPGVDLSGEGNSLQDSYGHGTFVAGLVAGNGASSGGAYTGEAPGAGLVSVKVAGASGQTDLATVILGVGWTILHRSALNIGVLNMSLGYQSLVSTVFDPLDIAVQKAWQSGIVVVTSAGNAGPFNGTILSPGDDPLVITAGAVDDQGQANPADDVMTAFSSVGPTDPDGWFKPDLVASGRSVISLRAPGSTIDTNYPSARIGSSNFVGSGTSFSAAITSGAAALVLQADPGTTPNDVKARLLGSTNPGPVGNPFVDGFGSLNVYGAVTDGPDGGVHLSQTTPVMPTPFGATVSLETTWSGSAWNGSAWNGSAWNGSAWNGSAWNGSAWNGSAWNGSAWNGSAWNGSAWNGSAWNGSAWN